MTRSAPARARAMRVLLFATLVAANLQGAAERVVAIADVHGAYDQFVSVLQAAGLIDKELNWTGGKTTLVQTGDVLDRGPRSRDSLELLMALVDKAAKQGGEVRPLLGNHEAMVMIGDLRYVSPEDYRSFSGPDSEKIRENEYENYLKYRKQRASHSRKAMPAMGETEKKAWLDAHPTGYFELRQAFSASGRYGKWLRSRDAVTQVGDTIFLHGGLSPELRAKNIKEINDRVRKDLETMDQVWSKLASRGVIWQYHNLEEAQAEARAEYQSQQSSSGSTDGELQAFLSLGNLYITSPAGPLWYRGYAQDPESEFAPQVDQILKRYKVRHIVVGHTVSPARRITPRFDGRVFLIDTGMLVPYFQGRPSALEISSGQFKSIYVGEPAQPLAAASGK